MPRGCHRTATSPTITIGAAAAAGTASFSSVPALHTTAILTAVAASSTIPTAVAAPTYTIAAVAISASAISTSLSSSATSSQPISASAIAPSPPSLLD